MGTPVNYPNRLRILMVVLIFYCTILPSKPVLSGLSNTAGKFKQQVVGSKPPLCVNKCLSCNPCLAILVVPPHQKSSTTQPMAESESYYLLSWKCRCGNRLFQP